jgi:hypothetical protein
MVDVVSKFVRWFNKSLKNPSGTSSVSKEIVRRDSLNHVVIRITTTGSPPATIHINNQSISITTITSRENFEKLQDNSGDDLPSDGTGVTIEAYSNTAAKQIIVFGLGERLRQRYGLVKDQI